jgi:hypothetical protein
MWSMNASYPGAGAGPGDDRAEGSVSTFYLGRLTVQRATYLQFRWPKPGQARRRTERKWGQVDPGSNYVPLRANLTTFLIWFA